MKLIIINGPNLNLIGKREPELYGNKPFDYYLDTLRGLYKEFTIDYYQSNIEGEIIDKIHAAEGKYDGIILNAGGFTHTSIAIADAISSIKTPVVEVHITNILARGPERRRSVIAKNCKGVIMGFGLDSYRLAVESLRL
ncbi:MAG: type II 3-dehydroquinate dehydratase [Marinilabiliales bacterium]